MVKKPTVISLFSGCGGSSLGYKWAGYRELLAIDFDKKAVETFRLNFPDVPCWLRDVKGVTGREILEFCGIKKGELDLLDASPPCQGFSTAGKRRITDPRNDLFMEFVRLIRALAPRTFVMENVSGMAKGSMRGIFNEALRELRKCGYLVRCRLMNAKWHGVAQNRPRLIFIGVRKDLGLSPDYPERMRRTKTFAEATSGIHDKETPPALTHFFQKWIPLMREGQSVADVRGVRKDFQTRRVHRNRPCPALAALVGGIGFGALIHPTEDRVLSIGELKRICSFPDDFKLVGRYQIKKKSLGNAVMPKFMEAIARVIKDKVLGHAPS